MAMVLAEEGARAEEGERAEEGARETSQYLQWHQIWH